MSERSKLPIIAEWQRSPSPAADIVSLAFNGTLLWTGSAETRRIYAIDPGPWTVVDEAEGPGTPWGMTAVRSELRVTCGEPPDDNRFVRRFVPGEGFDKNFAIPAPDDTGSHLGYDGNTFYLSQCSNRRILSLDDSGRITAAIDVPRGDIIGQVVVDGSFYLVTVEPQKDEEPARSWLNRRSWFTRVDTRNGSPQIGDLASFPFFAWGLAFDGSRFWTSDFSAGEIVAFSLP